MRKLREIKRKLIKRIRLNFADDIIVRHIEEIDITPTLKCNLNCVMCHQGEIKDRCNMNLGSFRKLLYRLKRIGVRKVSMTGGEIFVMPKIWKFIFELERMRFNYDLGTNAVPLTDGDISKIKRLKGLEKITTSLDGNQKLHNKIRRNPIAFQKTTENVKKLIESGIRVNVGLVVQKINFDKLEDIMELICGLGVKDVTFLIEMRVDEKEKAATKEIIKDVTGLDSEILISSLSNPFGELSKKQYEVLEQKTDSLKRIAEAHDSDIGFSIQMEIPELMDKKTLLKDYTCATFNGYDMVVYNNNELGFCPFVSLKGDFDLLENHPMKIVNCKEYVKLRKHFKECGAFPVCRGCCALKKKL